MSLAAYRHWATTPVADPDLSIVIPAYNEEERIVPTVGAIAAHLASAVPAWELVVADDGSRDATVAHLASLELANLRVARSPVGNVGKGDAVRRGMLAARGRHVLFADADQSTPIEQVDRLLAVASEGFDVVIGSRAADGASEANKSGLRKAVSAASRTTVRRALGLDIGDTQCGFKLFSRRAAQDLFQRQTITGFSFDLEVLFLAQRAGYAIAEVPVEWHDAIGSKVEPAKEIQRFLRDIALIRRNDRMGVYADA
jgi:dolichyl-phosphate beta-glucosyltransferase